MTESTTLARWNALVEGFRSFGGTANNVIQRQGNFGLGLFPIDSSQPVELRTPKHLLVSTDNLELQNGAVFLKDASGYPEGFADWYASFQADYSWGAEGRRCTTILEKGLKSLPDSLKKKLQNLGLLYLDNRFRGINEEQELFQRFIATRQINYENKLYMMLMIELINHGPNQSSWTFGDDSITVLGKYEEEVLVRYSISDPIRRFVQYGFNCREPLGFSLKIKLIHNNKKIVVDGGINIQNLTPPETLIQNQVIIIRKPLLGSSRNPRLPRSLFKEGCKLLKRVDADELFDQIQQKNKIVLVNIIKELEICDSEISEQLQTACLNQIEILSSYFGNK